VRTAWQNIIFFAGILNAGAVLLAATGKLGPVGAAVTHQLSSFFVMMNSLRLLHVGSSGKSRLNKLVAATWSHLPVDQSLRSVREIAASLDFNILMNSLASWYPRFRRRLIYVALVVCFLSGFYTVGPDETGVVERFGRKLLPYRGSGLHYKLPWPIERFTRVQAHRIRVIEIGFRSSPRTPSTEPAAYEWNVQHRIGRYQRIPEEALMLTGDQNMIELTATVHYVLERPDDFLFRQFDGDNTVRSAAESVIQEMVISGSLDDTLTFRRRQIETRARNELQKRLERYSSGVQVLEVKLEDVHPSLEVVDAFRRVSDAFEQKTRLVNEAEGYRNKQLALARGNARSMLQNASGYQIGRKTRADGDASRFRASEQAFRDAPRATESRLYLETMEAVLPGKKKLIIDKNQGQRHLWLMQDGIELPNGIRPLPE